MIAPLHRQRGTAGPPRILLITPVLPWPATLNGSGQRTEPLLRALGRCGEVDVVFNPGGGYPGLDGLDPEQLRRDYNVRATFVWPESIAARGMWATVARLPGPVGGVARVLAEQRGWASADPALENWVRQAVRERGYEVIVTRYLRPALLAALPRMGVPAIVDIDDVDWLKLQTMIEAGGGSATWKRRVVDGLRLWNLRRLCRSAMRGVDHLWVTNEADRHAVGLRHATVLPNIPHDSAIAAAQGVRPCGEAGRRALFIGGLAYEPNREGLDRFLQRVWPAVRRTVEGAELDIVGGGLDEPTRDRWARMPGVRLLGNPRDLGTPFNDAAFTVAPIYWGGGTRIKVLESYVFGRPCVATDQALFGHEHALRHGREVWHAPSDGQFIEGCVRLMREPCLRTRLAESGRAAVRARFSWVRFSETVKRTVETACGRPLAGLPVRQPASEEPQARASA